MIQRIPRFFDSTRSPGRKIDQMLPEILQEIQKKALAPREAIFQEWTLLLGEKMASLTQPISFSEGTLTVIVKSATLYSLLCQHERPRLLKRLKEKFSIRDLVFRVG